MVENATTTSTLPIQNPMCCQPAKTSLTLPECSRYGHKNCVADGAIAPAISAFFSICMQKIVAHNCTPGSSKKNWSKFYWHPGYEGGRGGYEGGRGGYEQGRGGGYEGGRGGGAPGGRGYGGRGRGRMGGRGRGN